MLESYVRILFWIVAIFAYCAISVNTAEYIGLIGPGTPL